MSGMVIGIGGLLAGCLQGIGSIAIGAGEVAVKGGILLNRPQIGSNQAVFHPVGFCGFRSRRTIPR